MIYAFSRIRWYTGTSTDDTSDQAEGAAGTTSGELMRYYSSAAYKGFKDDKAVSRVRFGSLTLTLSWSFH